VPDAAEGYGKHATDIRLCASSLANQLGGEHEERRRITFGMLEDRADTIQVRPLAVLSHDANSVIDAVGTIGDQR